MVSLYKNPTVCLSVSLYKAKRSVSRCLCMKTQTVCLTVSLVAELEDAAGGHVAQSVPGQQPDLVVRHGVKRVQQYPRLVQDVVHRPPALAP